MAIISSCSCIMLYAWAFRWKPDSHRQNSQPQYLDRQTSPHRLPYSGRSSSASRCTYPY
ncbi:hypothetical protein DSO57_1021605 [Entomophthora muscae]|uniref:Uncharacterized protein n=2 Tax=Entomophthora muscae TaxID=34485 RepID=A0ACC2UPS6_9FUNG|nr:hypothetical protein DSO57_1030292 [Entomophthora muscae]KAJ9088576.1 hypothetical protein DSO57_1021605 [Entomophthora muscae]